MSSRSLERRGVALAATLLAACADPTDVARVEAPTSSGSEATSATPVPASVEWNQVARNLVAKNSSNVFVAFRTYATLSVAQIKAVGAAERASSPGTVVSRRAAVAAASAVALSYVYPAETAALDSLVRKQIATDGWLERGKVDAVLGESIGRATGAAVVERVKTDRYFAPWTGTVPVGPGLWFSTTTPPAPPQGVTIGQARTYFLVSTNQFRPPPPPAFGSPEFIAALAEVRRISDTRTAVQDSIAKFWGMGAGTFTPPGYWNQEASTLATRAKMSERDAARLLALMNMVAMDAIIASHEAKYTYWLIRPWQADPAITLSVSQPNHPSYPSNHAAISAAMAEVIAASFPTQASRLRAAAEEAALSRIYGGIHYRFDSAEGLTLGKRVARWALQSGANVDDR